MFKILRLVSFDNTFALEGLDLLLELLVLVFHQGHHMYGCLPLHERLLLPKTEVLFILPCLLDQFEAAS